VNRTLERFDDSTALLLAVDFDLGLDGESGLGLIAIAVSASSSARSRCSRAVAWRSWVVSPRHSPRISGSR
jgi:hypothetical protein